MGHKLGRTDVVVVDVEVVLRIEQDRLHAECCSTAQGIVDVGGRGVAVDGADVDRDCAGHNGQPEISHQGPQSDHSRQRYILREDFLLIRC